MSDGMKCPDCLGRGTVTALLCGRGINCRERELPCRICDGSGTITEEIQARIDAGKAMRADRIRRGLSQREEAARLGITPQELSKREAGRLPE